MWLWVASGFRVIMLPEQGLHHSMARTLYVLTSRSLMWRPSPCSNSIPSTEAWLCTSKFLWSQHQRPLGLPGYWYTRSWGLQSTKMEGSTFRIASRTNRTRTSPTAAAKQQVLWPEIPTNKGESLSHLKRRLDLLQVPAGNEEIPSRGSPTGFAQAWQNLLGECRSSRILRSGVLLEWDSLPPLTRTLRQFLTKNKTEYLQKAMDSLLKKGAIEPVPRSPALDFFSMLRW